MATKITDLTELAVTAASGDFLHIIDVTDVTGGAAGTSKKIQVSNLPGGGGGSGTVTSVAMTVPAALSVAGSPITTSGTLAITGAGTTAEYIDGTGALQTTPTTDITVTNQADNRIITATAVTDTLTGESDLTYDGTTLVVVGGVQGDSINVGFSGLTTAGEYGEGANLLLGFTGSVSLGECVYLRTDNTWSGSTSATFGAWSAGLLAVTTSTNTSSGLVLCGVVYLNVDPGGSPGNVVYLSTGGDFSTTAVSATGEVNRVVGYQLATNVIYFNPSQDWIVLA